MINNMVATKRKNKYISELSCTYFRSIWMRKFWSGPSVLLILSKTNSELIQKLSTLKSSFKDLIRMTTKILCSNSHHKLHLVFFMLWPQHYQTINGDSHHTSFEYVLSWRYIPCIHRSWIYCFSESRHFLRPALIAFNISSTPMCFLHKAPKFCHQSNQAVVILLGKWRWEENWM